MLDLCCGPGRHSVEFAKAGFSVTGVDRTKYLLEKARARVVEHGVDVELVHEDMREFARAASFDIAVCLFTSFGFFEDHEENVGVLGNVFESLKPGGVFFLDLMGKEILARIFEATGSEELDDGTVLFTRRKAVDDWSRMEVEWTVIGATGVTSFPLRFWIYSGRELRGMLEKCGFSSVDLYGDLDWAPYDPAAKRLIAVARKD